MFLDLLGVFGVANLGFVWSPVAIAMVALAGVVALGGVALIIKEVCNYFGYGLNKTYTSEDDDYIKSGRQAGRQTAKERRRQKMLEREQAEEVENEEFTFDEPENLEIVETEKIEVPIEEETIEEKTVTTASKREPKEPDGM